MVAFFPADAPRYTVLTTIETRAQAGKAYYGGPLAGPVVKRMVDYIYNRGHDWYGRVGGDGPRRYRERVKGGDIAPDPPRGRPPLAPRLVRQPHGLGLRRGGQPLERKRPRACRTTRA